MAKPKKPDPTIDIFASTGSGQKPEPQELDDKIKPRGIGLKQSEWAKFDSIAKDLGLKPHRLGLFVLRDFMRRYELGEIETTTRRTLPGA